MKKKKIILLSLLFCVLLLLVSPWVFPCMINYLSYFKWYSAYALKSTDAFDCIDKPSYDTKTGSNIISSLLHSTNAQHQKYGLLLMGFHEPAFCDFRQIVYLYVELRPYGKEHFRARYIILNNPEKLVYFYLVERGSDKFNPFIQNKINPLIRKIVLENRFSTSRFAELFGESNVQGAEIIISDIKQQRPGSVNGENPLLYRFH